MRSKLCSGFIILYLFFINGNKTLAQSPEWLWAKSIRNYVSTFDIVVDESGNVYITGGFYGTVDWDPDESKTFNLTNAGNGGDFDIFIAKFDKTGNFVWAKSIGGTGYDLAFSIDLDKLGNIYLSGYYAGTVDFDPEESKIFNLENKSKYSNDNFVSKYDDDGNFIWAKSTGRLNGPILVDPKGCVYGAGFKLDNSGNFLWSNSLRGNAVALDLFGNIYTLGLFKGTTDFDPGIGIFNLISGGKEDIFISKLDSSGNFVWAKSMGDNENDYASSIAVDEFCNVYISGKLQDYNFTYNTFISKLDAFGNKVWAINMGAGVSNVKIKPGPCSNIYFTGSFQNTVDFDPDLNKTFNLSSLGSIDLFIYKLDNSGKLVWAKSAGGSGDEIFMSVAIDQLGYVYVTGKYGHNHHNHISTISFGSTILKNNEEYGNSYVAKLDNIIPIESADDKGVSVYPNPAGSYFNVHLAKCCNAVNISMTDMKGRIVYSLYEPSAEKIEISTNGFSPGLYILQIKTQDFTSTKKIIVKK